MPILGFMRSYIAFLSWVALAVASMAGPKLVCDQPLYDFGKLCNTQAVHHIFILKNDGDAAVEISRVISSCGCVGAMPTQGRIEPGQLLSFDAWINLKGRTGPQSKPVFAVWNNPAPDALPLRLSLIGTATASVEAAPCFVSFGVVGTTGVVERVVRVFTPDTNQTVHVTGASCADPRFAARVHTLEADHTYAVVVTALEPRAPSSVSTVLTINTDHPAYSVFTLPVYMRVHTEL